MAKLTSSWPTLIDVARAMAPNGSIAAVAEILQEYNDILDDIPWVEGNLPTGHQMNIRTSKPTPTFRLLNQGVTPAKSTVGQIVDTCAILEQRSHIDIDVAKLNGNTQAFRLSQDKGIMEGIADTLADTLIAGDVSVNPERFNGLESRYFSLSGQTTSAQVIDGGGAGADNTSIYLVCWAPDKAFGIFPKGSKAGLEHRDLGEQTIIDPNDSTKYLQAYASWYQWKCGMAIADYRYVVRIANIDVSDLLTASDAVDSSANILKLMSRAIDKLPPNGNARPVFYMNETVRSMLRVKLMDKGNVFLSLGDLYKESIPRGQKPLLFQGIPCRRVDSITSAESQLT